jgi:hypothetical protein
MRARPFFVPTLAATLVLCGSLASYAVGARTASARPGAPHVYRLDYAVNVTEPGKPARTSRYVMQIEDDSSTDRHAGENVPLAAGSSASGASPRQDVGVAIRSRMTRAGDDLLLHVRTELSAPEERADQGPRAIRKITASGNALVSPGKAVVVASAEEPTSHAVFEVTVAATKLR